MHTLRLLVLVPLSILCFHSTAQVDDLMRDKNISWMVRYSNNLLTDQFIEEQIGKRLNKLTPLKFSNFTEGYVPDGYTLQHSILEAIKTNKLAIYEDENCKKPLTYDAICRFDTLFDPNDYSKRIVERSEPSAENLPFFRARQVLFYDSSTVQFGLRTLSIALMCRYYNINNQPDGWKPAFWIKATDLIKKPQLSDRSITWAKSIRHEVSLKADSIKFLKKWDYWIFMDTLTQALVKNPKVSFYDAMSKKLTMADRRKLIFKSDTVSVINANNQIERRVVTYQVNPEDFTDMRVVQNWYWNDEKKRLEIWLWGIGPLADMKNSAGEFLFKYPYFYRRTDD